MTREAESTRPTDVGRWPVDEALDLRPLASILRGIAARGWVMTTWAVQILAVATVALGTRVVDPDTLDIVADDLEGLALGAAIVCPVGIWAMRWAGAKVRNGSSTVAYFVTGGLSAATVLVLWQLASWLWGAGGAVILVPVATLLLLCSIHEVRRGMLVLRAAKRSDFQKWLHLRAWADLQIRTAIPSARSQASSLRTSVASLLAGGSFLLRAVVVLARLFAGSAVGLASALLAAVALGQGKAAGWVFFVLPTIVAALVATGIAGAAAWSLARAARRRRALTMKMAIESDPRPPTLLLRGFGDDRLSVAHFERLEEIMVEPCFLVGPPVALGTPGEALPPLGAAREYLRDHAWQEVVRALITEAGAVLLVPGEGQGLAWEHRVLVEGGATRKTVLILPPVGPEALEARWQAFLRNVPDADLDRVVTARLDRVVAVAFDAEGRPRVYLGPRDRWGYQLALFDALDRLTSQPTSPVAHSPPAHLKGDESGKPPALGRPLA